MDSRPVRPIRQKLTIDQAIKVQKQQELKKNDKNSELLVIYFQNLLNQYVKDEVIVDEKLAQQVHMGTLFENNVDESEGKRWFYVDGSSTIHPLVSHIFNDAMLLEEFESASSFIYLSPVLTMKNTNDVKKIVDTLFTPIMNSNIWKKFWGGQVELMLKDDKSPEYIDGCLNKLIGTFIYAFANNWSKKTEQLIASETPEILSSVALKNTKMLNALSRIVNYYYLPSDVIIGQHTESLVLDFKRSFLETWIVFSKIDLNNKIEIQKNIPVIKASIMRMMQNKQYQCSEVGNQIFLQELNEYFKYCVSNYVKYDYLKKKVAEMIASLIVASNASDKDSIILAGKLFTIIKPYLGDQAKKQYKMHIKHFVSEAKKLEVHGLFGNQTNQKVVATRSDQLVTGDKKVVQPSKSKTA